CSSDLNLFADSPLFLLLPLAQGLDGRRRVQFVKSGNQVLRSDARPPEGAAVVVNGSVGIANPLLKRSGILRPDLGQDRVHLAIEGIEDEVNRELAPRWIRVVTLGRPAGGHQRAR